DRTIAVSARVLHKGGLSDAGGRPPSGQRVADSGDYVSLIRFIRTVRVVCQRVPTPKVPNSWEETVPNTGELNRDDDTQSGRPRSPDPRAGALGARAGSGRGTERTGRGTCSSESATPAGSFVSRESRSTSRSASGRRASASRRARWRTSRGALSQS